MKTLSLFFVLVSASYGLVFQCAFTEETWTSVGLHYSCKASVISFGSLTSLEGVVGTHLDGKNNFDVRSVHVSGDRTCNRIPQNIEKHFPNLLGIAWDHGNLTSISAEDLKPFPYLRMISIGKNNVVKLDGNLFKYSPKIRYIRFHTNFFEHIGQDLLTDLTDLQWVDFGKNPCIDLSASTTVQFEELNTQLPIKCPPLAGECLVSCAMSKAVHELKLKEAEQDEKIKQLNDTVSKLEAMLAELRNKVGSNNQF